MRYLSLSKLGAGVASEHNKRAKLGDYLQWLDFRNRKYAGVFSLIMPVCEVKDAASPCGPRCSRYQVAIYRLPRRKTTEGTGGLAAGGTAAIPPTSGSECGADVTSQRGGVTRRLPDLKRTPQWHDGCRHPLQIDTRRYLVLVEDRFHQIADWFRKASGDQSTSVRHDGEKRTRRLPSTPKQRPSYLRRECEARDLCSGFPALYE
jgi:hypothetical protein